MSKQQTRFGETFFVAVPIPKNVQTVLQDRGTLLTYMLKYFSKCARLAARAVDVSLTS
jgi:hypothetical protein